MKQALLFSLKVWLTAALITPVVVVPILYLANVVYPDKVSASPGAGSGFLYLLMYLSFLVMIGTLIPWLLTLIFLKAITTSRLSNTQMKMLIGGIITISFGLMCLIGSLCSPSEGRNGLLGFMAVAIATALSLWFYKLNIPAVSKATNQELGSVD